MSGKICLITGANSGLGKQTALEFAKLGYRVIMTSRDKNKGQTAQKEIISKSKNKEVDLFLVDFSSFKSVRNLAKKINSKYGKLDILINNAGTFFSELKYSEDKIELQFQVNYLSAFLLTKLLLNKLKKSSSARIINVASHAHTRIKEINFKDLYFKKKYDGLKAYSQSKLAIVLFTFRLAEKLKSNRITVNCLHPGGINTKIGGVGSGIYSFIWKIARPFLPGPESAAKAIVFLATSQKLKNTTGKYFVKDKLKKSSPASHNQKIMVKLWNLSEKLVSNKK